jgi:hypothetical protein
MRDKSSCQADFISRLEMLTSGVASWTASRRGSLHLLSGVLPAVALPLTHSTGHLTPGYSCGSPLSVQNDARPPKRCCSRML